MSVNVQYLHGSVMDIVMIKPTSLNAIMMGEIVVALVSILSIVLNAHVIIATSQSQVNLFCYNYTKRLFLKLEHPYFHKGAFTNYVCS